MFGVGLNVSVAEDENSHDSGEYKLCYFSCALVTVTSVVLIFVFHKGFTKFFDGEVAEKNAEASSNSYMPVIGVFLSAVYFLLIACFIYTSCYLDGLYRDEVAFFKINDQEAREPILSEPIQGQQELLGVVDNDKCI